MLLGEYSLELLVDGNVLPEFTKPVSGNADIPAMGLSYAPDLHTQEKKDSTTIHYAIVTKADASFSVRFAAHMASPSSPVSARVYVDGQRDRHDHHLTSSAPLTSVGFRDTSKSTLWEFKFNPTMWTDPNDTASVGCKYGGPGAISVAFYAATKEKRQKVVKYSHGRSLSRSHSRIDSLGSQDQSYRQASVLECKKNKTLSCTAGFNKITVVPPPTWEENDPKDREYRYRRLDPRPLALLHLHYRERAWIELMLSDLIVPRVTTQAEATIKEDASSSPVAKIENSTEIKIEDSMVVERKRIDLEDGDLGVIIIDRQTYETTSSSSTKRNHRAEVIEISDSDDDGQTTGKRIRT